MHDRYLCVSGSHHVPWGLVVGPRLCSESCCAEQVPLNGAPKGVSSLRTAHLTMEHAWQGLAGVDGNAVGVLPHTACRTLQCWQDIPLILSSAAVRLNDHDTEFSEKLGRNALIHM